MTIRDESWAVNRAWNCLEWHSTAERHGEGSGYYSGVVLTPGGIVRAYAQRGDRDYSKIDFIWRGRCYSRSFQGKFYTRRGIAAIASRFTRAVTKGR